MTDQEFQLKMTEQVTLISGQLNSLVESNKRQDQLFDEHRQNMKQSLNKHEAKVSESLGKLEGKFDTAINELKEGQDKLKSFVDRLAGIGAFLVVVIPIGLTVAGQFALSPTQVNVPTAEVR